MYIHLLKQSNWDTLCNLETTNAGDGSKRFKSLFLCMGASMEAVKYLRQVVVVDGIQLTGKFKECLLITSMKDGNFQIFSVAFILVDSENDAFWLWFFKQLLPVFGGCESLYFVSDRHGSIRRGVQRSSSQKQDMAVATYIWNAMLAQSLSVKDCRTW